MWTGRDGQGTWAVAARDITDEQFTAEVEADVGESNVAKLGPDQPAEVAVEAFPDRRYKAVLRQIIPTADRTKATVQVKVSRRSAHQWRRWSA